MNQQKKDGATSIVGLKKNCMVGLETSHTRLSKNAILIDTKADGSCHLGPG